ncbi:alpha-hydroxy-acid oxidizing enzyme [Natronococcus pandeyae]|uniref:Alpha-hydroxy-acid oxidizing enzyme n=1 Tax=Natronococcus pandeyae TaxID=2055836 RepID=A0A8J8TT05_9EURY|nr:lactate 2-monooxygenase [Natronococcus pandeyae]TYL39142.1 alpha-hydroxy-acid oxidizing enzyme [Natronococcus pandeyae]
MTGENTSYGPDRQEAVYRRGMLEGEPPEFPVAYEDLEERAREELSEEAFAYVAGGAGSESTVEANDRAFDEWQIVPRILRDVSDRDLSIELFGREIPVPVLLAPIGVQSILHDEAELAVARAASDVGVPMISSSVSSYTMEEIAGELDAPGWFQLYWSADRDVAASFLERAEDAGFEAVVVTLDTPKMGWRERDIELAYLPFLEGQGVKNYFEDDAFCDRLETDDPWADPEASLESFTDCFGDASLTWDDLSFLREHTDLPIILKGVLHPDDAARAVECGMDGVIVSNHGGRQVDGAIPALEALPGVVDAVGDEVPVLFDSGIRRGSDAVRAIALGADAVLLGRPYAYGLGIGGEDGVRSVLKNFLADLDLTVGLSGCASIDEVDRSTIRRAER